MVVELNVSRLRYLLTLYGLSEKDFLKLISDGLKKPLSHEDIFTSLIDVKHLKRVDDVFKKGLSFYTDPSSPPTTKDSSIFFRKTQFADELNFASKRVINDLETFNLSLSATAKILNIKFRRTLPKFTTKNDPKKVADQLRKVLSPEFNTDQKIFLASLINNLARYNVLVLEFIENWNQHERANIDGAFLVPNVIILKRQPGVAFRREIFTLVHEFGHYLLNVEEVEHLDYDVFAKRTLNSVEKWCNDFAFYFLINEHQSEFARLVPANSSNDYHHSFIEYLSNVTHLSQMALYTRLLFDKKISQKVYNSIRAEAEEIIRRQIEQEKEKREQEKLLNPEKGGGRPKPINSELLVNTIQAAFDEGVISEYEKYKALRHKIR